MISVICPKSSRAIGWSCEDQQSVSHLQDFYTYQRPLMSLPTLQQGRTFTNWLRRKRIPQVRTWGDFISHQLTHKYMHTAFYLVLDLQCTLRDVPDLKLTCCVSWDQDGVFRLIWAQAQHTFTRLLWSIELAWDEEGDTEQYSYSKANTKKPISCIMSNLDQFYRLLWGFAEKVHWDWKSISIQILCQFQEYCFDSNDKCTFETNCYPLMLSVMSHSQIPLC